jgi:sugar lactone lactonase YvrE
MSIPSTEARVLVEFSSLEDRFLPEGPRTTPIDGREALVWVNIQTAVDSTRGNVHLRFWDSGERRQSKQLSRPGFIMPTDRPGFAVVGQGKEIGLLDLRSNSWESWATIPDANPRTIINDGEIVPGGRAVVFGTKDVQFAAQIAHLYVFSLLDRTVRILADGQTCSNGKFFSRSGQTLSLFDIDTPRKNVVRYRFDPVGLRIEDLHVVLDLHDAVGFPDGMVSCGDGTAIIAFYNPDPASAGKAIRFDMSTGAAIEEWTTPFSPRVTCPLLVKRGDKVQLVLTTADEGMPPEIRTSCLNAGNLFIAETRLETIPPDEVVRL